jgi:signal transduction histidine kinase
VAVLPTPGRSRRRYLILVAGSILVVAIPVLVLIAADNQAQSLEEAKSAATATRIATAIDRRLQSNVQVLLGARGLLRSSKLIERSEWATYVGEVLDGPLASAVAIGWVMGVPADQRRQASALLRATGHHDTPITSSQAAGSLVYPIIHVYGSTTDTAPIGHDLANDAEARSTLARAEEFDAPMISGPLGQPWGNGNVMLALPLKGQPAGWPVGQPDDTAAQHAVFVILSVPRLLGSLDSLLDEVSAIRVLDAGRPLAQIAPPHGQRASDKQVSITFNALGRSWQLEVQPRRADAPWSNVVPWMLAGCAAALGALGLLLAVQISGRQERAHRLAQRMTADLRTTEEELRRALAAAHEAARTKDEFLAVMSHELRTPLNGVIGMTSLLLDSDLDAQSRDFAETARTCATGLLDVINDILDYSKLEAGKIELEQITFNPRDLIEEVLQIVADRAQSKGLELVGNVDADVGERLRGDPARLRQILLNLASNAVKFTDHGSVLARISVIAEHHDRPLIRFSVQDTGIGISSDQLNNLFEPFTQADGSISRRFGGTGLGLAICKRLAQAMGGRVAASSSAGVGSTFFAEFTLQREEPSSASALPSELSGRLVLLVEDHPEAALAARRLLADCGCQVVVASHLSEGFTALDGKVADLAVLDACAPGDDQAALVASVRSEAGWGSVPVVLLTHLATQSHIDLPHTATLGKPLRRRQLRDALVRALNGAEERITGRTTRRFTGMPVLIADHRLGNMRVLGGVLSELGCRVDMAGDTDELISASRRVGHLAVFLASDLPPHGAASAVAILRSERPKALYVATGTTSDLDGCDAVVASPPRSSEVVRLLAKAADRA